MWLTQMLGIVLVTVVGIFITRALGPEERGIYTWLLALSALGTHVALFGLDASNRRLAVEKARVPVLIGLNALVIFGLGALVVMVLGGWAWQVGGVQNTPLWLVLALVVVPLNGLAMALNSVLLAQGRILAAAWMQVVPKVLVAVCFAGLLWWGWVEMVPLLVVNILAAVVVLAWPLWWLRDFWWRRRREVQVGKMVVMGREVGQTFLATYVAGLSVFAMQKIDVVLVNLWLGNVPTGFYGVASNLVDLVMIPFVVMGWLLSTRAAAQVKQLRHSRQTLLILMGDMGLAMGGSAVLYVIAPKLVELLFGAEFIPAGEVLRWLCPAIVALAMFTMLNPLLLATASARVLAIPALVGVVVNVGLNVWFLPVYGLWGAAMASLGAYALAALVAAGLIGWFHVRAR